MHQYPQHHLLLAPLWRARTQRTAHVPLDHAVCCLALVPLPVDLPVRFACESLFHKSPPAPAGWFAAGTTDPGGDDRSYSQVMAGEAMMGLRIKTGLGPHPRPPGPPPCIEQQIIKVHRVGEIADPCPGREDQMR